jgi:hypothetical protein
MTDADVALPLVVTLKPSFINRFPSPRLARLLLVLEPGYANIAELMTAETYRVAVFRYLVAEFPARDTTSIWMHTFDVEVGLADEDPLESSSTPEPLFDGSGVSIPTT